MNNTKCNCVRSNMIGNPSDCPVHGNSEYNTLLFGSELMEGMCERCAKWGQSFCPEHANEHLNDSLGYLIHSPARNAGKTLGFMEYLRATGQLVEGAPPEAPADDKFRKCLESILLALYYIPFNTPEAIVQMIDDAVEKHGIIVAVNEPSKLLGIQ